jgi:hypothetical protein
MSGFENALSRPSSGARRMAPIGTHILGTIGTWLCLAPVALWLFPALRAAMGQAVDAPSVTMTTGVGALLLAVATRRLQKSREQR